MPLNDKGQKIMRNMKGRYGEEKGEKVFYASKNKGTISGVEGQHDKKPHKKAHGNKNRSSSKRTAKVGNRMPHRRSN